MSTTTTDTVSPDARIDQRSFKIGGALLVVLGLLAIAFPFVTGLSLSILLGALLVVGALVHVAHAFSARKWTGSIWQILLAVLYGFAGISLLANPVLGLLTLSLLLVSYFLVDGVVEIAMGVRVRPADGWVWLVGSGVLSLLLAVLLWVGWPATAAWALGLFFGLNLLSTGLAMILFSSRGEEVPSETAPTGERPQQT
ncbi:HdeD family acid-resistance protein [Halorussus amylolyticus]|uniref:HdeD family acid-resistance protein n=1 Tax=Halorussus amylolyticus TaxID=1126242 RepID=UPI001047A949|nr:DUF308 domain-containing protein [Halorussus amylolyticus]